MIVHVVSRSRVGAFEKVRLAAAELERRVEIRHLTTWPDRDEARWIALLLLDLIDPPAGLLPPRSGLELTTPLIVVFDSTQSRLGRWVDVLRRPSVKAVECDPNAPDPYAGVTAAVLGHVGGLEGPAVARGLVTATPALSEVSDLITVILNDPWRIRRPRHLATQAGLTRMELKRRCASLKFERSEEKLTRAEYFITLVRWLAYEHLTATMGVGSKLARILVGVADASNFRHQVRRLRRLAILVAVPSVLEPLGILLP